MPSDTRATTPMSRNGAGHQQVNTNRNEIGIERDRVGTTDEADRSLTRALQRYKGNKRVTSG